MTVINSLKFVMTTRAYNACSVPKNKSAKTTAKVEWLQLWKTTFEDEACDLPDKVELTRYFYQKINNQYKLENQQKLFNEIIDRSLRNK